MPIAGEQGKTIDVETNTGKEELPDLTAIQEAKNGNKRKVDLEEENSQPKKRKRKKPSKVKVPLCYLAEHTPNKMSSFFNEEIRKLKEENDKDWYAGKPSILEKIFEEGDCSVEKVKGNLPEIVSGLLSKRTLKNIKTTATKESCKIKRAPVILFLSYERLRAVKIGREIANLCPMNANDRAYVKLTPKDDKKKQTFHLKRYINIVTGTPRRVLDHLQEGSLKLTRLKLLLLDGNRNTKNQGFMDVCREQIRKPLFLLLQTITAEHLKSHFKISVLRLPEDPKKKAKKLKKTLTPKDKRKQQKLKKKLEARNQDNI